MEVVSGSGKWKYCEVVVDGPNEPPYYEHEMWWLFCTLHEALSNCTIHY